VIFNQNERSRPSGRLFCCLFTCGRRLCFIHEAGGNAFILAEDVMVSTVEELTGLEHKHKNEDAVTTKIEDATKEIPSSTFLAAGVAMMGVSALLAIAGKGKAATFFGQWVPTILVMGLYNKVVKEHEE
jgi:hypothetical protein